MKRNDPKLSANYIDDAVKKEDTHNQQHTSAVEPAVFDDLYAPSTSSGLSDKHLTLAEAELPRRKRCLSSRDSSFDSIGAEHEKKKPVLQRHASLPYGYDSSTLSVPYLGDSTDWPLSDIFDLEDYFDDFDKILNYSSELQDVDVESLSIHDSDEDSSITSLVGPIPRMVEAAREFDEGNYALFIEHYCV